MAIWLKPDILLSIRLIESYLTSKEEIIFATLSISDYIFSFTIPSNMLFNQGNQAAFIKFSLYMYIKY